MTDYKKYLWMELIGLDNTVADMGVSAYIDNLGFTPDGISIFMWGPDFVNLHCGLEQDEDFPPDIGAYLDVHYQTYKHNGPPWTKFQLKRVVDEFHRYGVEVYYSIFPLSLGNRFHQDWMNAHPETNHISLKEYQAPKHLPVLNPWKRMADGSYYEDFLISQAVRTAVDYGFDGWHVADGFKHGWYQIFHGDFSDDMIDQFVTDMGVEDANLPLHCDGDEDAIDARGRYIWREHRKEWITFFRHRNRRYYEKIIGAFHAVGKKVTCNTCSTRDPVESLYRWGIDYRDIVNAGIDHMVIETCSAATEMLEDGGCGVRGDVNFFSILQSTSILTRAMVPEARILFNNCTQDITEGWSILRHFPSFLEREISLYSNLCIQNGDGSTRGVFDGLQVCLAADIENHEWQWLHKKWDTGFSTVNSSPANGFLLVWSDSMADAELDSYLEERTALTAPLLAALLNAGFPVSGCIRLENAHTAELPLLLINPGLLPQNELEQVKQKVKVPVLCLGKLEEGDGICLLNSHVQPGEIPEFYDVPPYEAPEELEEPKLFCYPMHYRHVNPEIYKFAVELAQCIAAPLLSVDPENPDANCFRFAVKLLPDGTRRVFIGNENVRYVCSPLFSDREIVSVKVVNGFWGRPIFFTPRKDGKPGSQFFLRLPPKGVGIIDITLKG